MSSPEIDKELLQTIKSRTRFEFKNYSDKQIITDLEEFWEYLKPIRESKESNANTQKQIIKHADLREDKVITSTMKLERTNNENLYQSVKTDNIVKGKGLE